MSLGETETPVFNLAEIKTREDFLEILPMMQSLLAEEGNTTAKLLPPAAATSSWERAKAQGYRIYAAKNANEILGVMGMAEIYDPLDERKSFRINNFIVEADFRGLGIGTAMMEKAEQIARKEKAEYLVLEVLPKNRKAARFYKTRNGFAHVCDRLLKTIK